MSGTPSPKIIAFLALPLCGAMLAWGGMKYSRAKADLRSAESQHRVILTTANEIEDLRHNAPTVAAGAKPQPNISGQVTDVLVEAGLAPMLLTSLTPESDSAIDRGTASTSARATSRSSTVHYRRQSVRLTLEPTTLPDLGRFLAAWESSQPQWTISSITITPVAGTPSPRPRTAIAPGSAAATNATEEPELVSPNRPVRVNLFIECVYVDQPSTTAESSVASPSKITPR